MRLYYLLGVLIVIFISQVYCDELYQDEENRDSLIDDNQGIVDDRYEVIPEDENNLQTGYQNPNFDYNSPEFGNDETMDESIAYWESIYGTEDVPDFQTPPEIDGESIYIDLADLEDSFEDDEAENNFVKRTQRSDFFRSSASVEDVENLENSEFYQPDGYLEPFVVSDLNHEPIDSWDSEGGDKSEYSIGSEEMEAAETRSILHGNRNVESFFNSKLKLLQQKKDFINSATVGAHKIIDDKKGLIDSVMASKADLVEKEKEMVYSAKAAQHDHEEKLESIIDAKFEKNREFLQSAALAHSQAAKPKGPHAEKLDSFIQGKFNKKKEMIHSATVAGLGHGYSLPNSNTKVLKSHAETLESVLEAKANKKKEIIDSATAAGLSHGLSHPKKSKVLEAEAGKLGSILELKADAIEKKKEVIQSAAAAKLDHDLSHIAKDKETLDSLLKAKADRKKEIVHSATVAGVGHGLSHPKKSKVLEAEAGKLGSILELKADAIDKKKEVIQSAAAAKLDHDLSHIAKDKETLDSLLKAKADRKKEIVHSATVAGVGHGLSHPKKSKVLEAEAEKLGSILELKADAIEKKKEVIQSAAAAKLDHDLSHIAKDKETLDSLLKTKADRKKEIVHSATVAGVGHGLSHPKKSKVLEAEAGKLGSILELKADDIEKKKEIIHSATAAKLGHDLSHIAKDKETLDSLLKAKADRKKEIVHSATVAGVGHGLSHPKKSKVLEAEAEKLGSILELKADDIEKKKEIIHSATVAKLDHDLSHIAKDKGTLESVLKGKADRKKEIIHSATAAGVGHGLSYPKNNKILEAKADKLDTILNQKADDLEKKKELIHTATVAGLGHGLSHPKKSKLLKAEADKLESILDLKTDEIEKKKELIHSAAVAGLGHGTNHPAKSKILKAEADKLESILDLKADDIDKKKEFIHSAAAAGLGHGLSHPTKSKILKAGADKLETILDLKADDVEKKKELIHSVKAAGLGHGLKHPQKTKILETEADKLESILDLKAGEIEKKKELIHTATVAGLGHGLKHPKKTKVLKAEADKLESILDLKADKIEEKKDFIHSAAAAGLGHGLSHPKKSKILEAEADKLESILDLKADDIEKKKGLIHTATAAGLGHGLSHPTKSKILKAEAEKLGSVLDLKADDIEKKKELIHSPTVVGLGHGLKHPKKTKALKAEADKLESILDLKSDAIEEKKDFIHSAAAAELRHGLSHPKKSKILGAEADKLESILDLKADDIEKKKELIHTATAAGLGHGLSHPTKSKILKAEAEKLESVLDLKADDIEKKKELIHSPTVVGLGHGLRHPKKSKILKAEADKLESILDLEADEIEKKKDFIHSTTAAGLSHPNHPKKSKVIKAEADKLESILDLKANDIGKKIEIIHPSTTAELSHGHNHPMKTKISEPHSKTAGSILEAKADDIEKKTEIINSGIIAGPSHPTKTKISRPQSKKIQTILESKAEANQRKKETINSATAPNFGDGLNHPTTKTKISGPYIRKYQPIFDPKSKKIVFQPKQHPVQSDIVGRGKPQLTDAIVDVLDAKKESSDIAIPEISTGLNDESPRHHLHHDKSVSLDPHPHSNVPVHSNIESRPVNPHHKIDGSQISSRIEPIKYSPHSSEVQLSTESDASKKKPLFLADEIIASKQEDKLGTNPQECASGLCGISGKLYVDSNNENENSFELESQPKIIGKEEILRKLKGGQVIPHKQSPPLLEAVDHISDLKKKMNEKILDDISQYKEKKEEFGSKLLIDVDDEKPHNNADVRGNVVHPLPTLTEYQDSADSLTTSEEDGHVVLGSSHPQNQHPLYAQEPIEDHDDAVLQSTHPQYKHPVHSQGPSKINDQVVYGSPASGEDEHVVLPNHHPVYSSKPIEDHNDAVLQSTHPDYKHPVHSQGPSKINDQVVYGSPASGEDEHVVLPNHHPSVYSSKPIEDHDDAVLQSTHPQYKHPVHSQGPSEINDQVVYGSPASGEDEHVVLPNHHPSVYSSKPIEDQNDAVLQSTHPHYKHPVHSQGPSETNDQVVYGSPALTADPVFTDSITTSEEDEHVVLPNHHPSVYSSKPIEDHDDAVLQSTHPQYKHPVHSQEPSKINDQIVYGSPASGEDEHVVLPNHHPVYSSKPIEDHDDAVLQSTHPHYKHPVHSQGPSETNDQVVYGSPASGEDEHVVLPNHHPVYSSKPIEDHDDAVLQSTHPHYKYPVHSQGPSEINDQVVYGSPALTPDPVFTDSITTSEEDEHVVLPNHHPSVYSSKPIEDHNDAVLQSTHPQYKHPVHSQGPSKINDQVVYGSPASGEDEHVVLPNHHPSVYSSKPIEDHNDAVLQSTHPQYKHPVHSQGPSKINDQVVYGSPASGEDEHVVLPNHHPVYSSKPIEDHDDAVLQSTHPYYKYPVHSQGPSEINDQVVYGSPALTPDPVFTDSITTSEEDEHVVLPNHHPSVYSSKPIEDHNDAVLQSTHPQYKHPVHSQGPSKINDQVVYGSPASGEDEHVVLPNHHPSVYSSKPIEDHNDAVLQSTHPHYKHPVHSQGPSETNDQVVYGSPASGEDEHVVLPNHHPVYSSKPIEDHDDAVLQSTHPHYKYPVHSQGPSEINDQVVYGSPASGEDEHVVLPNHHPSVYSSKPIEDHDDAVLQSTHPQYKHPVHSQGPSKINDQVVYGSPASGEDEHVVLPNHHPVYLSKPIEHHDDAVLQLTHPQNRHDVHSQGASEIDDRVVHDSPTLAAYPVSADSITTSKEDDVYPNHRPVWLPTPNEHRNTAVLQSTHPQYEHPVHSQGPSEIDDQAVYELPTLTADPVSADSTTTSEEHDRDIFELNGFDNQHHVYPVKPSEQKDRVGLGLPTSVENSDSADFLSISEEDDDAVLRLSVPQNQHHVHQIQPIEKYDHVVFGLPTPTEYQDPVHSLGPNGNADRVAFELPSLSENQDSADSLTSEEEGQIVLGSSPPQNQSPVYLLRPHPKTDHVVSVLPTPTHNHYSADLPTSADDDQVVVGLPHPRNEHPVYPPKKIGNNAHVASRLPILTKNPDFADSLTTSEETASLEDNPIVLRLPIPAENMDSSDSLSISDEDRQADVKLPASHSNPHSLDSLKTSQEDARVVFGLPRPGNPGQLDSYKPRQENKHVVYELPDPPAKQHSADSSSTSEEEKVYAVSGSPHPTNQYFTDSLSTSEEDDHVASKLSVPARNQDSAESLSSSEEDDHVLLGLPLAKKQESIDLFKKTELELKAGDKNLKLNIEASLALEKSSDTAGEIAEATDTKKNIKNDLLHNKKVPNDGIIVSNSRHQIPVQDIDDLEDDLNDEDESSTYEDKFVKHYSNAAANHHQQQPSQNIEKLAHFQSCYDGSLNAEISKDGKYYNTDEALPNANCRLINLDVNCSEMTAFMNPECQQLNVKVWQPQESGTPITLWTVKTYLSHGQELAMEMQDRAKWLCDQGLSPQIHTPAMLHTFNNFATDNIVEINQESEYSLFGTKLLQRRFSSEFDVTPNTFVEFLRNHAFRVIGTGLCHPRPKRCESNQLYRTYDGACNNREHPRWGQSNTAFSRLLPARYHDGVHEPPKSVLGKELPNARALSLHCFSRQSKVDLKMSLALSQWAQLLSHDFSMQAIDRTAAGGIRCCADGKQLSKRFQHHSCLPIDIPADDIFYSKFQTRCMNFVRSMTISREDCTLGPADQMNTVTSYLDASPVYGSNKETCDKLRAFKDGRMSVSIRRGRELMPTTTEKSRFCDVMSPSEVCYLTGDLRANQNPQLAILQTIFVREHNRIADQLASLNKHWEDERIFQESRKIVIAEYQHITYNEWLPIVIGKRYCQRHRLTLRSRNNSMSMDYDPRIKAAIINSFGAAAFRMFHSTIEGDINLCPANRDIAHTLRLSNHFFRPQIIERSNNLDDLIRGLVSQPMQQGDRNFHPEISGFLFRSRNEYGMDLQSLDIQRGRDHGLPCYNAYRKLCGLNPVKDFDDLIEEIEEEDIKRLKSIYAHVDDIDLVVGSALEKKSPGSILGPTVRCILSEQFYRSKIGDRYFYDNADQPHSFTQEQFQQIRKASLARLLCDNGDYVENIQPRAFRLISKKNPIKSCCDLPQIDLSPWRELNY